MKHFRILLIFQFYFLSTQAQTDSRDPLYELKPNTHCDININYTYYKICYSQKHLQSFWTMHRLTKESIKGKQKRANNFKRDHRVSPSVDPRDYKGSNYNMGHLVPAGDMKLNKTAMSETFYMTNVSPQKSSFNSGVWASLESGIRKEVLKRGDALVITAPVLISSKNYDRIWSGVSIPDQYYKIAYFHDTQVMLAYLIPNASQKGKKYKTFQLSVNKLEQITGIDFFSELDDELEKNLENKLF